MSGEHLKFGQTRFFPHSFQLTIYQIFCLYYYTIVGNKTVLKFIKNE